MIDPRPLDELITELGQAMQSDELREFFGLDSQMPIGTLDERLRFANFVIRHDAAFLHPCTNGSSCVAAVAWMGLRLALIESLMAKSPNLSHSAAGVQADWLMNELYRIAA